jgi:hypothetical protein
MSHLGALNVQDVGLKFGQYTINVSLSHVKSIA